MKTKLIPCPNITKRELMTALMEGRKFIAQPDSDPSKTHTYEIHWDSNHGYEPVREGLHNWNWRGFKYLHEIVEQKWWEDPEMVGKPVKVSDALDGDWRITSFLGYDATDRYPFKAVGNCYKYAEPLTAADLYQGEV